MDESTLNKTFTVAQWLHAHEIFIQDALDNPNKFILEKDIELYTVHAQAELTIDYLVARLEGRNPFADDQA